MHSLDQSGVHCRPRLILFPYARQSCLECFQSCPIILSDAWHFSSKLMNGQKISYPTVLQHDKYILPGMIVAGRSSMSFAVVRALSLQLHADHG